MPDRAATAHTPLFAVRSPARSRWLARHGPWISVRLVLLTARGFRTRRLPVRRCCPSRRPICAVPGCRDSSGQPFRAYTFAAYERARQRTEAIEAQRRVADGVSAAGEDPDRIVRCCRPRNL